METKGVTCKIPLELHQQASEEMQGKGLTVTQYIEMVIQEHMNGGINMANNRTLAFQVNDELFQNIKAYLARYEEVYHKKLTQREFVVGLIQQALEEAEEKFASTLSAQEGLSSDEGEPTPEGD